MTKHVIAYVVALIVCGGTRVSAESGEAPG